MEGCFEIQKLDHVSIFGSAVDSNLSTLLVLDASGWCYAEVQFHLFTLYVYYICYYFGFTFLQGLKTGMYYLRTLPAANAIQFTVDKSKIAKSKPVNGVKDGDAELEDMFERQMMCSIQNKESCLMCSS